MTKTCSNCGYGNEDSDLIFSGGVIIGKDGDLAGLRCVKCGSRLSWWDDDKKTIEEKSV